MQKARMTQFAVSIMLLQENDSQCDLPLQRIEDSFKLSHPYRTNETSSDKEKLKHLAVLIEVTFDNIEMERVEEADHIYLQEKVIDE